MSTSLCHDILCTFHSHFPAIWYLLLGCNLTGSYGDYTVLCMHDVGRLFVVIDILFKVSLKYLQCKNRFLSLRCLSVTVILDTLTFGNESEVSKILHAVSLSATFDATVALASRSPSPTDTIRDPAAVRQATRVSRLPFSTVFSTYLTSLVEPCLPRCALGVVNSIVYHISRT